MAGLSDGEAGRIRHQTPMSAPGLRLFTEEGPDVSRAVPQRKGDGARDRIEKGQFTLSVQKKQERPMSLSNLSLNIYLFVYRVLMSNPFSLCGTDSY